MRDKSSSSILRIAGVLIFSLWVVPLATESISAADKIRVGFSAISFANAPVWIAEEKGFFKKYDIDAFFVPNIETETIIIGGGGIRSLSAVIAGDLQFGSTGDIYLTIIMEAGGFY